MAQIVSVWIVRCRRVPSIVSAYTTHPGLYKQDYDVFRADVELPDADPVVPVIKVEKEADNAE